MDLRPLHPWHDQQGQSPFVWGIISALSQATALPVTTALTCPTVRIHPAIIAQAAAATAAAQLHGRFVLGVGSGEALTEQPVPIKVSGFGEQSAELAGRIGDGCAPAVGERGATRPAISNPAEATRFRRHNGAGAGGEGWPRPSTVAPTPTSTPRRCGNISTPAPTRCTSGRSGPTWMVSSPRGNVMFCRYFARSGCSA